MLEKVHNMIRKSLHNIILELKNNRYFIMNLLLGEADILDENEYKKFLNEEPLEEFISKGYIIDSDYEKVLYNKKYLEFLALKEEDELQLFFVPNYSCNFECNYCFQKNYVNPHNNYNKDVIDSFFTFIQKQFNNRRKYITLFGGEPLLMSKKHKEYIYYFFKKAFEINIDVAIVTNGYNLREYLPIIQNSNVKIREIQITLDGTEEVHNLRRKLKKSGESTFKKIIEGIDLAIKEDYPINLRVVVDAENIENLPQLAKFAIEKGWTGYNKFKTQIGRNYDLHSCIYDSKKLFSRIELYENLTKLIEKHPYILEFHSPDYFVVRDLKEKGVLPLPVFDVCPATKTEWAFDYTGKIYPCTATVGKIDEHVGTFYPYTFFNKEKLEKWNDRDVLLIDECKNCNLQLICGGGCAALAKNKKGDILKPDCRPVKEIVELGLSLYFKDVIY